MQNYKGIIIGESLKDKAILKDLNVISTTIEQVTPRHQTPWLSVWTMYEVEIRNDQVMSVAQKISESLESEHQWYADFKNDKYHFIIFKKKIFKINRTSKEQYAEVKVYGISRGIPEYQVNFHPIIAE